MDRCWLPVEEKRERRVVADGGIGLGEKEGVVA